MFMLCTSGVCRKYSYGQLNENGIVRPCVCVCVCVDKVYQINGSIVGRSKEDKNFSFTYIHGYVCVCI